jgi:voltage-gated potassium channel
MTLRRWERLTEWPLMAAAVAFLVAYAIPILRTHLPGAAATTCSWITWITWAMFALDYPIRVALADRRGHYIAHHLLDLAAIALPLLRPLRLLRLATLLSVLNRQATTNLRGRVAIYVAGGSALLAFCGSLAVLDAERANPEANIKGFGDALGRAVTTMTTVGYGDRYPTTGTGRLVAAGLMLGGIAILGTVTATLASWLVQHVAAEEVETHDLHAEVIRLRQEVAHLLAEQQLHVVADHLGPPSTHR